MKIKSNIYSILYALFIFAFLFACTPTKEISTTNLDDGIIEFVFLQANDVYEIAPLEGGRIGGLARVATERKQLLAKNKNTLTVHAGDFLNPSLIGTVKYKGEKIKGKHMIQVMNAVGFDLTTYGNHEFDLDEDEFQSRLDESRFEWTSCNTYQKCGDRLYPFYRTINGVKHFAPETYTWEIEDSDGTAIKVGIFGVTLPVNQKDYVHYDDFYTSAKKAVADLSRTTDVVIGLTHLELDQDLELAAMVPSVPLFMGGHDHDNMKHTVGNTVVTKADANAKTVYVHTLTYNKNTKKTTLKSELKKMDESVKLDNQVDVMVQKWNNILMEKVSEIVDEPNSVIYTAKIPLDGRESSIRHTQCNLGQLIVKSVGMAVSGVDGALVNSGSVRIDDQIQGEVTPIDFFRALPYGGQIYKVKLTGDLLNKVLDEGEAAKGKGGYLQRYNFEKDAAGKWLVAGKALDTSKNYSIAINDFLLAGYDIKFFTPENKGILEIIKPDDDNPKDQDLKDLRIAIINHVKTL